LLHVLLLLLDAHLDELAVYRDLMLDKLLAWLHVFSLSTHWTWNGHDLTILLVLARWHYGLHNKPSFPFVGGTR